MGWYREGLYIEKAFITRLFTDVLKRRKFHLQSSNTATIDAHGYDCSYSHNYTLSVKLACLMGKSADGVYMAVRFISAWGLRLLVSTARAIPTASIRGASNGYSLHASLYMYGKCKFTLIA